jgi:hypothetical protein
MKNANIQVQVEGAIQSIVESVVFPKLVQIAHGKTVVAGITYSNDSKINHIDIHSSSHCYQYGLL